MKHLHLLVMLLFLAMGCKKSTDMTNITDHFTLRFNGADMPVWVEGNAASKGFVILVHGGPGGDDQIYNTYLEEWSNKMEADVAMMYYDQRSSGNSSGHMNKASYTLESYVKDLDKLVDLIHSKYGSNASIFLMGHSWGGTLTTAYLLDASRQAKIKGFVEVDGAHDFKSVDIIINSFNIIGNEQIAKGQHVSEWQTILDYCARVDPNAATNAQISQLNSYGFTAEGYLSDFGEIVVNPGRTAIWKYTWNSSFNPTTAKMNELYTNGALFEELKNTDLTNQMTAIKLPSLFLWGSYDMVVPKISGLRAFNKCKAIDKKLILFNGSGHSPMIDQMQDFVDVSIPWLKARI